ncbi:RNA 2'-phosphotransferase [archaeon]|nr:RNA 2'-phosphotransferase [archaeon]
MKKYVKNKNKDISKFLSYVLRHHPAEIKIELDDKGRINVDSLLTNAKKYANLNISLEDLYFVVKNNDKKRFDLTDDLLKIRANQGHSIEVDLDLPNIEPTEYLYHGTATRFLDVIQNEGLKSMERHDVHLSFSKEVAISVGERHGKPVVLKIKAREMFNAGFKFNCTKNNVWLTETVPSMFFEVLEIFNKEKQVLGSKIK